MNSKHCDWMHRFGNEFKQFAHLPLNSLFLPGSHDSGAYILYTEHGIAPDRPDLIDGTFLSLLANLFPCIVRPFIARFSRTQNVDVLTQLEFGVRYLDLRVAFNEEEQTMRICHNLYADPLQIVLDDVHRFVQKFSKEIIILDFQHFHNFENEQHIKLLNYLNHIFEGRLIPEQEAATFTLNDIWSKYNSERIIIIYRDHFINKPVNNPLKLYWTTELLPNPWPNTRNPEFLKAYLQTVVSERCDKKLFVTQAVLTPNTKYSLLHFFSSLKPLADKANNCLRSLIDEGAFATPNGDPGTGPNIIMTDFVTPVTVEKILRLNVTTKSF